MTRISKLRSTVAALATALLLASPAAAGSATTYQGTFDGDVAYLDCTATRGDDSASGRWVVVVRGDSLVATFNILVNGKHHVSFAARTLNEPVGNETFAGTIATMAGTLHISLTGSTFTYEIPDYTSPWDPAFQCGSVTFPGVLTTPNGQ